MEISPILQSKLLLLSALFGVTVGVAWDITASVLCALQGNKTQKIFVFLRDLLLVATSGIGLILLCYYFNKGELRAFAVLGFVGSFFCCRATLGGCVRRISKFALRLAFFIIRGLFTPFLAFFKYLVNILQKTLQYSVRGLAKIIGLVYNIIVKKSILQKAKHGFLK